MWSSCPSSHSSGGSMDAEIRGTLFLLLLLVCLFLIHRAPKSNSPYSASVLWLWNFRDNPWGCGKRRQYLSIDCCWCWHRPSHPWLLSLPVTPVGLASSFYNSQTSPWCTQLIFGTHWWVLPPIQKRLRKSLERLLRVNVEASIFLGPRPKSLPACGDPTAQHMTGSRCLPCHGLTSLYRNSARTSWVGKRAKVKIHSLKHNHRHADLSPLLSFPSPWPPPPPFSFSHNFNQWNHLYIILTKEYRLRRSPPRLKSQLATYKRSVFTSQMLFLH